MTAGSSTIHPKDTGASPTVKIAQTIHDQIISPGPPATSPVVNEVAIEGTTPTAAKRAYCKALLLRCAGFGGNAPATCEAKGKAHNPAREAAIKRRLVAHIGEKLQDGASDGRGFYTVRLSRFRETLDPSGSDLCVIVRRIHARSCHRRESHPWPMRSTLLSTYQSAEGSISTSRRLMRNCVSNLSVVSVPNKTRMHPT